MARLAAVSQSTASLERRQRSTTTPLDIELVDRDMLPASEPVWAQARHPSLLTCSDKAGLDEVQVQAVADTPVEREGIRGVTFLSWRCV